ncbi:TatD family hydrolase [Bremerella sp. P1]|uniref:TatD family hydrolase n=1 Tax=Bremerella sp. P1 TaxID=3026424 RepID=UPI0023686251|nr:TatD family hydrolase [Bremerella sp. P1]WDI39805.1 TatD family hydrolase [Bremerella sp. P1]
MEWIDTHAHLFDEGLLPQIEDVLSRAQEAGVGTIVAIGTTLEDSRICVELAERFPQVYASVGIHPNHSAEAKDGDLDQVEQLISHPKVVAVGETGLDRYWDFAPIELQKEYLQWHVEKSRAYKKPLVIHMRDCEDDIIEWLESSKKEGPLSGILHSYTGNAQLAELGVACGMHISFAGMLTFKRNQELRDVAKTIPVDRLLVETDCPYLSPEPCRKQRPNEPALVVHTGTCLANERGVEPSEMASITTANARKLFGIAES